MTSRRSSASSPRMTISVLVLPDMTKGEGCAFCWSFARERGAWLLGGLAERGLARDLGRGGLGVPGDLAARSAEGGSLGGGEGRFGVGSGGGSDNPSTPRVSRTAAFSLA